MADDTRERYINPYTDFGFKKLFGTYPDAERRQYEASQKEYWDYTSTLETASDNRAKEIAREMKSDGVPTSTIVKYTKLPAEEIEAL